MCRVDFVSVLELGSCGNPMWEPIQSFCRKNLFKINTLEVVGWLMGLEPTTTGITILIL
jgi:hypothetical protein